MATDRRTNAMLRDLAVKAVDGSLAPTFNSVERTRQFTERREQAIHDIVRVLTKLERSVYRLACEDRGLRPQR